MTNATDSNKFSLATIDPKKVNLLVPTADIVQINPFYAMHVHTITANLDPEAGEVYESDKKFNETTKEWEVMYTPAKPLLMKIANAAGIIWNYSESGPMTVQPFCVIYKAVCAIRLMDGSLFPIMGVKEIDLTVIEEEMRENYLKKAKALEKSEETKSALGGMTPEQWAETQTKTNMIQWRKHKLSRAETGAMLRAIRAALGIKGQYTKEEISRPFAVPRIDFSPDYHDPLVRQTILEQGLNAMRNSHHYGSGYRQPDASIQTISVTPPSYSSHMPLMAGDESDEMAGSLFSTFEEAKPTLSQPVAPMPVPTIVPAPNGTENRKEAVPEPVVTPPVIPPEQPTTQKPASPPVQSETQLGTSQPKVGRPPKDKTVEVAPKPSPVPSAEAQQKSQPTTQVAQPSSGVNPTNAPPVSDASCSDCNRGISTKVADYSRKNFGVPLCMACQSKHPKLRQ